MYVNKTSPRQMSEAGFLVCPLWGGANRGRDFRANMKFGAEQAMDLLGVSESDRAILMKEL